MLTVWRRLWPSSIFGAHHAGFADQLMFCATRKLHNGSNDVSSWRRVFDQHTVERHHRCRAQGFWNTGNGRLINHRLIVYETVRFRNARFRRIISSGILSLRKSKIEYAQHVSRGSLNFNFYGERDTELTRTQR